MKFSTAIAVASLAAAASAQTIQINNPTKGTSWKAGNTYFVSWSNNCASMGNSSRSVAVELVNGPSTSVNWVADIGTLDCSGSATRANVTIPDTVKAGEYSVRVRTLPLDSFSAAFNIEGAASVPPPTTTTTGSGETPKPTTPTGAGSALVANVLAVAGLAAVAALQLF